MSNNTKQKNMQGTDISRFFNLLLENFKLAAIFILNKEGTIVNINTGTQRTLGYSHEDLIGKNFAILFREEDRKNKMPQNELATVLEKGSATDDNFILHKSGKEIWVHGESAFTQDDEGNIFIIKLVYNLTHQKEMEKALKEKNEELDKLNKDLDIFVYAASHDLKAPINNIAALVKDLSSELDEEIKKKKEVNEVMEMINVSIDKFKKTINDLSIVGRLENGASANDVSLISFSEILEDVKFNLVESIDNADPLFFEDFSKVPVITFSRKILRSVMQNLVSNAIKFRSTDRRPEIKITTEDTGKYILLKVEDNGLGIAEKDIGDIFSMYKRLHSHMEGTGVGMSIVKRMLDNTGGKIEVKSEIGKGTTFNIYFKPVKK